jgi:hypothetical protein
MAKLPFPRLANEEDGRQIREYIELEVTESREWVAFQFVGWAQGNKPCLNLLAMVHLEDREVEGKIQLRQILGIRGVRTGGEW